MNKKALKARKIIESMNSLTPEGSEHKLKQQFSEFSSLLTYTSTQDNSTRLALAKELLGLNCSFYAKMGDGLLSSIWKIYSFKETKTFLEETVLDESPQNKLLSLFFSNSKLLLKFQAEISKIKFAVDLKAFASDELDETEESVNFILDVIVYCIYQQGDFKHLYVSLCQLASPELKPSVPSVFKLIALYGLSFAKIEEKHNVLDTLLYFVAAILIVLGRGYLKSKGKPDSFKRFANLEAVFS